MLSVVLGLVGAIIFGSADFLGGLAAKRLRSLLATAIAAVTGLALLLLLYPFVGGAWTASDILWGALSGIAGVFAIVLLYACLALGPMSILSPLTAVVSAIAPMLWGLFVKGESFSGFGYAGLGIALVAVVLVGFIPGEQVVRPSVRALVMAVGSGLAIGAFMVLIDQTSDDSGLVPLILNRGVNGAITFAAVGVIALVAVRRRRAAELPLGATPTGHADLEHAAQEVARERAASAGASAATPATAPSRMPSAARVGVWLAVACGVVDVTANTLMLVALRLGDLSIVSVLTAMYPAGTIVLAAIVLRERIAPVQWVGLVLALTAGGLFALA